MKLDKLFDELDTQLKQRSTDFEEMRNILAQIKETEDVCRWMA
jgi:hypothetical protein